MYVAKSRVHEVADTPVFCVYRAMLLLFRLAVSVNHTTVALYHANPYGL